MASTLGPGCCTRQSTVLGASPKINSSPSSLLAGDQLTPGECCPSFAQCPGLSRSAIFSLPQQLDSLGLLHIRSQLSPWAAKDYLVSLAQTLCSNNTYLMKEEGKKQEREERGKGRCRELMCHVFKINTFSPLFCRAMVLKVRSPGQQPKGRLRVTQAFVET